MIKTVGRDTRFKRKLIWSRLNLKTGCLEWMGALDSYGYAIRGYGGILKKVHRVVLAEKLGRPILPGMYALHSCDNPKCINAQHLREGTAQDNAKDRVNRGRWKSPWPKRRQNERKKRII